MLLFSIRFNKVTKKTSIFMNLTLILGDQLSHSLSSLKGHDKEHDLILMAELGNEATYVKHHKKKIAFIFSAMRHFAAELKDKGYKVHYISYVSKNTPTSFTEAIEQVIQNHPIDKITITEAGEYRVMEEIKTWENKFNIPVTVKGDERFLCTPNEFKDWAEGRKQLRMEYFYREMRKKYNILMDGDSPAGGEWNYDSENRKPPKQGLDIPATYTAQTDDITREVMELVAENFDDHFGDLYPFYFAVTRDQALYALDKFITERLVHFGDYQDAMIEGEPWMYHSHIGFYLNCGLLTPLECAERAEQAYRTDGAPLNAVEGFIRQIIGWREYVRGIYWLKMPAYETENFLDAKRDLPALYWGAPTHMNCLKQCVSETKQNAYAHHIQRLMVLGNFALIAGLSPAQVNEWYMIVYADAYQWVELPNVTGMILFADGGYLGSKPYAAGGAYINRMSNYCAGCKYKVAKKNGAEACPFNYLYWDFFLRNTDKVKGNPRLNNTYGTLNRMDEDKKQAIRDDATRFFKKLDAGEVV